MKVNFNPKTNVIYLDMDGVLADFDAFIFDHMGRTFPHELGPGEDQPMWDFLLTVPRLFYVLPKTEAADAIVDAAFKTGARVEILTALPRRNPMPGAEQDKIDWVKYYYGDKIKVNFGPYSSDKWTWAKPGDVLVDDRRDNIQQWINDGLGIGIYHDINNSQRTIDTIARLRATT